MQETDAISQCIVRIPLYYDMDAEDIDRVIKEINGFYGQ